jgi:hypothetical protein
MLGQISYVEILCRQHLLLERKPWTYGHLVGLNQDKFDTTNTLHLSS